MSGRRKGAAGELCEADTPVTAAAKEWRLLSLRWWVWAVPKLVRAATPTTTRRGRPIGNP